LKNCPKLFFGGAKNIPTAGEVGGGDEQNFEKFFLLPLKKL